MTPTAYFAETYSEARQGFLAAADAAGARLAHFEHPTARGPRGEPLFLDTAWFGPADAPVALLNCSGTHGAEGFPGSAAQIAWMRGPGAGALPPGVAVLLVHAVNPFGFAHMARNTENNVDLNRNWVDHDAPYPQNPLYDELHPHLVPKTLSPEAFREILKAGERFVMKHGTWALEDAITRGQYTHPDGYHFGGHAPEWSTQMLRQVIVRQLAAARHVAFIDWHSGPAGDGDLIYLCFNDQGDHLFARAADWWGPRNLDRRQVDKLWGTRRPTRNGIMFWGLQRALAPQADLAGAVIEFCSSEPSDSPAGAMRVSLMERWLRFEGGWDAPEAPQYMEEMRNNYAPRRESWRRKVIDNALEVYERTLQGAARWASDNPPPAPGHLKISSEPGRGL